MIAFRKVAKRFGRLDVLRGVDLVVRPGCVTAILGPNAAGKTTIIKLLLGLAYADGGEIRFDGEPLDTNGAYRARIGYMPQIARFPENLTGAELLRVVDDLRPGCPPDDDLVFGFDLHRELTKPLRTLSGGTRQKLNAVIAFRFRPELLILDEPTAGLDPLSASVLKDRIVADRALGRTIVITSHVMSELDEIADDVAYLVDGTVQYTGPIGELKQRTHESTLERAIAKLMSARLVA